MQEAKSAGNELAAILAEPVRLLSVRSDSQGNDLHIQLGSRVDDWSDYASKLLACAAYFNYGFEQMFLFHPYPLSTI